MKLRNKKTGEIWDIGKVLTCDYPSYETLKQLNDDWEDVEDINVTSIPLIKDEEIREAIRAWAKVVGKDRWFVVSYNVQYHDCCIYCASLIDTALIDIGKDLNVKEGSYTFAELCGEEEE